MDLSFLFLFTVFSNMTSKEHRYSVISYNKKKQITLTLTIVNAIALCQQNLALQLLQLRFEFGYLVITFLDDRLNVGQGFTICGNDA